MTGSLQGKKIKLSITEWLLICIHSKLNFNNVFS